MKKLNILEISNVIIFLFFMAIFISCGTVAHNIGYGLSEREIEDSYNDVESIYNTILDGQTESSEKNWNDVIKQFSKIVDDHPKSKVADNALYNVGMCYIWSNSLLKDSPQKAIKAFNQLIKSYPKSDFVDEAQYWKAYAYSLAGDYKRAVDEYEKFGSNYPQSSLYPESIYQLRECRIRLDGYKKNTKEDSQIHEKEMVALKNSDSQENKKQEKNQKSEIKEKESPKVESPSFTQPVPSVPIPKKVNSEDRKQDNRSQIKDIRFSSSREFTRVVLDHSKPTKYETKKLEKPLRLCIDIKESVMSPAKQNIPINDNLVKGIRASQFDENTVRVVLDLKDIKQYKVFSLKEPDRIVFDIYGQEYSPEKYKVSLKNKQETKSKQPSNTISKPDKTITLVRQLGLKVKTIVIDPGHGGKDPGAMSKSGMCEKNFVLDIGKRLRNLLRSKGSYDIRMTRETDVFVPLEERTDFANQNGADLFVSIHVNASRSPDVSGIETYYLSLANDEESRLTASLENASADRGIRDLASLIGRILKTTKITESRAFANVVQSHLCQITKAYDRGVRRAPFIVLIGANAPSILAELGFISNEQDEKLLNSEEYKDRLAKAIMDSIEDYVKTMDST
jgi:N-acetylmuramoyl-L-alanine amidase